jgi:hypothetical protein
VNNVTQKSMPSLHAPIGSVPVAIEHRQSRNGVNRHILNNRTAGIQLVQQEDCSIGDFK